MPYKDPLAQKTYKRLWDERNRDKRLAYDRHRRARTNELIASLRAEIQRLRARRRQRGRQLLTRTLDRK